MSSSERARFDTELLCPECGGTAHLLTVPGPDDPVRPGDVLAYRCADCSERLDIVVPDAAETDPD